MLAWLTEGTQRNITVRGVTVIHDDHDCDYPVGGCDPCVSNQATIGAVHGGSGTLAEVTVENLVAETAVWRPLWLGIDKSFWAKSGRGHFANVTFMNVSFACGGDEDCAIMGTIGSACSIAGGRFDDFTLGAHAVHSAKEGRVNVSDACAVSFSQ